MDSFDVSCSCNCESGGKTNVCVCVRERIKQSRGDCSGSVETHVEKVAVAVLHGVVVLADGGLDDVFGVSRHVSPAGMLITIAGGPSTEEVRKPSLDELMALALALCVKGVLSATAGRVGGGKE